MDAFALLCLQMEWGADEAIDDDPVSRLRPAAPVPTPIIRPSAARLVAKPRAIPTGTPAERALAAAGTAEDIAALNATISGFDGCGLRDTATHTVLAEGPEDAGVMLIGDAPGREEDRSGRPFAGPDGQLLDQMLASIGLQRASLLLTHLLPWRPPGERPPSAAELTICLPFLHRLLVLVRPRFVMLLGGLPARTLLGAGAARRRGVRDWMPISIPGMQDTLPALVMPGLSELAKKPPLKRDAWAGWRRLRHALDAEMTEK